MSYEKQLDHKTDSSSVEKGGSGELAIQTDPRYHFDAIDLDRVQRRLKQRHVQMIAIAGTLGTGLFLGSGHALAEGGPAGALIGYALVGSVGYATLCSLGEMTSFAPISGTFPHYAARWADPALGFALGWNYFYSCAISTPTEITAACILLTFWDSNQHHQAAYTAVVTVCVCAINIFGVRWFGEAEFFFSIIKIALITMLIISGLVIDLGGGPNHDRIGFRYWKDPGAFAPSDLVPNRLPLDKFLGFLSVIVQAAFSFQGMELVAIAASETESPRRNIAKAVRRVFWRILIFYILGILITGMLVPYNDPNLLSDTGTAAESPYVIAIQRAGISALPSVINALIFTSAFSAGNSFLFSSSRILYGLALRGQAPRFLTHCTKKGLPIVSVLVCSCFAFLSFMSVSSGANTVFLWLQNLSTTSGFFSWGAMCVTYLRFYKGLKVQGIDRKQLTYWNRLQPYLAIWSIFWLTIFILITGYAVFWSFNASDFLTDYISLPLFLGAYVFWKVVKRTKYWRPEEMDFVTGIPTLEETEIPEVPPKNIWEKIANILF
ncbi:general APC amino acid permease [Laetiporus sulphureus 93-53]|uniref:General APC amino acid permease n=1 Tax=Laetiporus sulphureus 93-53 TaxID=1314785 RepID=A0A165B9U7_9APHY|nr:general APC amino acid permease [Laetiporus sulphureus 93-53]KZT00581.1 general APC amino acid permease [Laetiporus sulphureus 93-53]